MREDEKVPRDTTMIVKRWQHFIGGRWVDSDNGDVLPVENPSTGDHLADVARASAGDVDRAVDAARRAFASRVLVDMRPADRGALMLEVAGHLKDMAEEIAVVDCLENGKPIQTARNEPAAAVRYFMYYAGLADKLEGTSIPLGRDYVDYTVRAPFGVSAQIVPWNFPVQIAARSIACAIATGNTVVLKTPELSPLACTYLAKACSLAGVPDGVVNVVSGYGNEAGAALVAHHDIDHIVFTGSVATGQSILRAAAECTPLDVHKKACVLDFLARMLLFLPFAHKQALLLAARIGGCSRGKLCRGLATLGGCRRREHAGAARPLAIPRNW